MNSASIVLAVLATVASGARATLAQRAGAATEEVPSTTSYELIDRALGARRITDEIAHKYRVFAAFGDSRLPAEYHGVNRGFEAPPEVLNLGSQLKSLSPQVQAELAPFFMRPEEPGSWITLSTMSDGPPGPGGTPPDRRDALSIGPPRRFGSAFHSASLTLPRTAPRQMNAVGIRASPPIQWRTFSAVGGKAKVWAQDRYPGDAAKAEALANELTRHIWRTLTGLMNQEPEYDANLAHNGGDDAFDFYLVHAPMEVDTSTGAPHKKFEGLTMPASADACDRRKYILLDSKQPIGSPTSPGILSTAAHELMHAITLAYGVADNSGCGDPWIVEASATWAENYVYPKANAEHVWPKEFLNHPRWPIDRTNYNHEYGAYLLPYFVQMTGDQPQFMRAIWGEMKQQKSLAAINRVLSGGWDEVWPKFLIANWNQPPVDQPDGYRGWDDVRDYVRGMHYPMSALGRMDVQPIKFDLDPTAGEAGIPYMAGAHFTFKFDRSVRSVVFTNTIARLPQPHTAVWGLAKLKGEWKEPKNWTRDLDRVWCRDDANEDIEELILVFGNSDWQTKKTLIPFDDPTIKTYPTGCTAWSGSTTTTNTITSTAPNLTITEVVTSTMRFVVDSGLILRGQPREYWKVQSGSLSWRTSVTGDCSGGGSGGVGIRDMGSGNEVATLRIWEEDRKMHVSGSQGPWPEEIPRYTINCPRGNVPTVSMVLITALGWFNTDSDRDLLSPDGKSFGGDFTSRVADGAVTTRFQYQFRVSP